MLPAYTSPKICFNMYVYEVECNFFLDLNIVLKRAHTNLINEH